MLSGVSFIGAEKSQNPPQRSHSLVNITKEKLDPIRESTQDVERARHLLDKHISDRVEESGNEEKKEDFSKDFLQSFARMIEWVEKLAALLRNEYDNQLESETALMLAESNLQMALANNEMLEDALKQAGPNVKDVGWRRLSERERLRQVPKEEEEFEDISEESGSPVHKPQSPPPPQTHPAISQHPSSSSLRFFNFPSLSRSALPPLTGHPSHSSARAESPTGANSVSRPHFHSRPSSPAPSRSTTREKELSILLDKEKEALKSVTAAKLALENEIETLSQALFEEANKMVSTSNRKLAEVEEELRMVMEEREALRGALRIVEGENGVLRAKTSSRESLTDDKLRSLPVDDNEEPFVHDAVSANYLHLDESSSLADPVSFITISPVDPDVDDSSWDPDTSVRSEAEPFSPSELFEKMFTTSHITSHTTHSLDHHSHACHPISQNESSTGIIPHSSIQSTKSTVRWSVMPQTPRSRTAVKKEFEKAMQRMEQLIEDVEEGNLQLSSTEHHKDRGE